MPIGTAAHSFGLETMVTEGHLRVEMLGDFLADWLEENGVLEAVFLRAAWRGGDPGALNATLSARKPARESRTASLTLGRRFLQLAAGLQPAPELAGVAEAHLSIAFGLVARAFGIAEDDAAAAYLQQSLAALISACQRLLPLGQSRAAGLLWDLHPSIRAAAGRSGTLDPEDAAGFMPLVDLASMLHPSLETRLFIS